MNGTKGSDSTNGTAARATGAGRGVSTDELGGKIISVELSLRDMVALRAGETIIAAMFVPFLPLWQPLLWLGLVWTANIGVYMYRTLPRFADHETALRLRVIQSFAALDLLGASSAGYLLHVPGNLTMQLLLQACLNVVATMWILERPRNSRVGGIGAALIAFPAPVMGLIETEGIALMGWLLTVGQACFCLLLWFFAVKQERAISEHIALRQEAEQAREQLARASAAKVQFFAAASHDLRQPVHAIGLYLASVNAASLPPHTARVIAGIHQSWSVLDGLLVQILDLARLGSQQLTAQLVVIDLHALARDVAYTLHPAAQTKGIRIVVLSSRAKGHTSGAHALADAMMLRRVLSNLVDNAIKFSPRDTRVVIALRPRHPFWAIEVRDAGVGIDAALHDTVFDEFVQLNNPERQREEGFGLGLSVVKAFVQAMNGQISIRSRPGLGSSVRVLLPRAAPQTGDDVNQALPPPLMPNAPLRLPEALSRSLHERAQKIVLVEDDLLVRDALVELMNVWHLPYIHVTHAEEALKIAPSSIAVAVCDLRLPGRLQGRDLALRLHHAGVPTMIMSGEQFEPVEAASLPSGIPMLRKPVHPQAFVDCLEALVQTDLRTH